MLDIKYIRENSDKVKEATAAKQMDPALVDKVLELDEKRRNLIQESEKLRADRNTAAKEKDIEKGKEVKKKLKEVEPELKKIEKEYKDALFQVPNLAADDVPVGKDESENKTIRTWGEPTKFDFEPKDHMLLGEKLGIIDTKRSAIISGARFNYLMGDAVLLQFALIQFALMALTDEKIISKLSEKVGNVSSKPFIPVITPVLAKSEIMKKMDRFDPIDDRFYLKGDGLLLIGSTEHTLGPLHIDQILKEKDLPIRYLGYSTAFRREAGTYGKDTSGILRRHQFDQLELESFTVSENGESEQELLIAIQEYFMQQLEIPYQVVVLCTGDMGKPDIRHVDIEAWLPGQNEYRETHTSDYMGDYQARRLNTRVRNKNRTEFVHMNDATAFAMGRTIIAILENYQQKDGSVKVPEVLRKWVGKEKITS